MKKLRDSFFTRLIAILLLVNIPVIIGMLVFFSQSISSLKAKTVETVRLNQDALMKLVESDIDYVKQQLFKISNMSDWKELDIIGDGGISYDGISAINRFRERFQNTIDTSRLFSDVWANIKPANCRFSVKDGLEEFNQEEYEEIRSFYLDSKRVVGWRGRMFIASQSGYLEDAAVNITAEIDMQKLWQLMETGSSFPNEEIVFVFHGNEDTPVYNTSSAAAQRLAQSGFKVDSAKGAFQEAPLLIHSSSSLGDFSIYSLIPASDVYSFLERMYASMLIVLLGTIVAIASYFLVVGQLIKKPIQSLIHGFRQVEKGNFTTRLERKGNDEIARLFQNFNVMSTRLADLINENYIQEIYAQRAIYRQLQSQINPHFLYNSFYVLQHMIQDGDNENAEEFSVSLGQYYKFLTKTSRSDVPLKDEMLHTTVYMDIMKKRYGRRMAMEVYCEDAALLEIEVPRLILQPFVENIFMHGIGNKRESLQVYLSVEINNNDVVIHISDNGKGIDDSHLNKLKKELLLPDSESDSAIFNINKRLKIKFGVEYGVSITNVPEGGCRVELRIPYTPRMQGEKE